jgi:hypothetical protein
MLTGDFLVVARLGSPVPYMDDFWIVPALTGQIQDVPRWLWSQHNEHRLPLPRLLLWGLCRLGDGDFRVPMAFTVAMLGVLAGAMVWAASRIRGRIAYADVFFPVALLHVDHCENFLWAWQVGFVAATCLTGIFLVVVVCTGPDITWRSAATAGCVILLPLCGANGVAVVPALGAWLVVAGFHALRGPVVRKGVACFLLSSAASALSLVAVYFLGFERPGHHPPSPGLASTLSAVAEFVSMGFGWFLPRDWRRWALLCLVLWISGAALATRGAVRQPKAFLPAVGIVCVLAGMTTLAGAIGWGRAGVFPEGYQPARYVTLAVLGLCAVYFSFILFAKGPARWVPAAMACVALLTLEHNTSQGLTRAAMRRHEFAYVERDIAAGVSIPDLARRYSGPPFRLYPEEDFLAAQLRNLRDAKIGVFAGLP